MEINTKLKGFLVSTGCPDINEALIYLLACKHELKSRVSEEVFSFLQQKKMIRLNLMTNKIECLVAIYDNEEFTEEFDDTSAIEEEVRSRIDEYRQMFKGIRANSIGVKAKVVELITRFCIQHNVSFDDVLMATKVYMQYIDDIKLMSNADNFITKLDKDGNEISLLQMAIEEQSMDSNSPSRTYKVI